MKKTFFYTLTTTLTLLSCQKKTNVPPKSYQELLMCGKWQNYKYYEKDKKGADSLIAYSTCELDDSWVFDTDSAEYFIGIDSCGFDDEGIKVKYKLATDGKTITIDNVIGTSNTFSIETLNETSFVFTDTESKWEYKKK